MSDDSPFNVKVSSPSTGWFQFAFDALIDESLAVTIAAALSLVPRFRQRPNLASMSALFPANNEEVNVSTNKADATRGQRVLSALALIKGHCP